MAARRKAPEITREDLMAEIKSLNTSLLDPEAPLSLISVLNTRFDGIGRRMDTHDREVKQIREDFTKFKNEEFAAFKASYEGDRNKAKGWLAGAALGGGGVATALAKFLKLF